MTYSRIRRADKRRELDRLTWAGPTQVLFTYEIEGIGGFETELMSFGTVFESKPFFSYGTELQLDETLTLNDYPMVMCGVSEWEVTETDEELLTTPYYLGSRVWIRVATARSYRLLFRLSFEGVAMRNVETWRGGANG